MVEGGDVAFGEIDDVDVVAFAGAVGGGVVVAPDVEVFALAGGDGPVDLVFICDWIWNVELQWENPLCARFLERLSAFSRLLLFDKRGSGLSDRTVDLDLFTLEVRIDDVRAVMEAAGSEQAVLFGHGDDGAALASVFAAANPDSTRALILYATRAKVLKAPDYPWGYEPSAMDVWASERESFWGTDGYARRWLRELAPSVANDDRIVRWYSRLLRQSASPGTEEAYSRWMATLDLRGLMTTDAQGGTSTLAFTHLRQNVGLADKEFTFRIPRGVDVITDGSRS